jgi:hypothetical protein
MSTMTLHHVESTYRLDLLDHLDRQAQVPTVTGLAFQGDVAVVRDAMTAGTGTPIPAVGVPVVRGENGGNTHLLVGDGLWAAGLDDGGLVLGYVTVGDGDVCLLSHPEHGALLLSPGTYEMKRQREQADQVRRVQD